MKLEASFSKVNYFSKPFLAKWSLMRVSVPISFSTSCSLAHCDFLVLSVHKNEELTMRVCVCMTKMPHPLINLLSLCDDLVAGDRSFLFAIKIYRMGVNWWMGKISNLPFRLGGVDGGDLTAIFEFFVNFTFNFFWFFKKNRVTTHKVVRISISRREKAIFREVLTMNFLGGYIARKPEISAIIWDHFQWFS